jgi:hypothetical protein
MLLNVVSITNFKDEDGRSSKHQIAEGDGCYYLFDTEIGEVIQEMPGIIVRSTLEIDPECL